MLLTVVISVWPDLMLSEWTGSRVDQRVEYRTTPLRQGEKLAFSFSYRTRQRCETSACPSIL